MDHILVAVNDPQSRSHRTAYALPRLGLLVGREAELAIARERWLKDREHPLLIYGPPGIGKSKLALALLHDKEIIRKFGNRRYQVRCDPFQKS
jgi:transcriptional regulator with AAA-type ATPase domain